MWWVSKKHLFKPQIKDTKCSQKIYLKRSRLPHIQNVGGYLYMLFGKEYLFDQPEMYRSETPPYTPR